MNDGDGYDNYKGKRSFKQVDDDLKIFFPTIFISLCAGYIVSVLVMWVVGNYLCV